MDGRLCAAWDNLSMVSVVHSLRQSAGEADALSQLCLGLPDAAAARVVAALALAREAYGEKLLGTGEPILQHALGMALMSPRSTSIPMRGSPPCCLPPAIMSRIAANA